MGTVVDKTTKHYPKLQNLKENRHLVIEAIQKYETEESRAVLNQYIGVLTMQAKDKAVVAEAREALKKLYQAAIDARAAELVTVWHNVLRSCRKFVLAKQEELNLIGFDDLESLALKLLHDSQETRQKYQQNLKYLMVDEFQDTPNNQFTVSAVLMLMFLHVCAEILPLKKAKTLFWMTISARWIKFLISVMQPSRICWGLTKRRMCFLKRCGPTVQVRFCRNLL